MSRPSFVSFSAFAAVGLSAVLAAGCRSRCCPTSPCGGPTGGTFVASGPTLAPASVDVVASATPTVQASTPEGLYDALLKKYVQGDYVDYAAWKAHPGDLAALDRFLAWQASADAGSMSREDAIAFYINAYNSLNIKMILDNYPVHSPMDIPGYFDKITHPIAGEQLTVSAAEYDRLIANYKDMRAHFAVVCSDRGCLPLRAGAWKGATLDADLEAAAKRFVSDPRHFKVDHEKRVVEISKIFEWYGQKFTQDPVRPAEKPELFLLPYVDARTRELLESGDYELKIIEWNWTINEK